MSFAKRKVIRAGRRGGKTIGVSLLAIKAFVEDGKRVLYTAPTQDQVDSFWTSVKNILRRSVENGDYYKNESRHIIELEGTKQRIRAKTAWNADTLRGDYADLLIFDEFQLTNEDAWEVVGAPMLMDNNGDAVFIYTPPSIRTAGVSKARDKKHAKKLFDKAANDTTGRWAAFHFSSHENPYISAEALDEIADDMTAIAYRQEILAEDIDEVPGALWTRDIIEETRVHNHPDLSHIYVGVDPKGSKKASSKTGVVVGGLGADRHMYILDDMSIDDLPQQWGRQVITAYHKWKADMIIAEVNYGGDMVKSTIQAVDRGPHVKTITATRGKAVRAEPISVRWAKKEAHMVGSFYNLEEQMCTWIPGDPSPDELDAMVWACTELGKRRSVSKPKGYSFS